MLAARYARGRRAARSSSSIGGAPPADGLDPAAVDAARRLVEAGARPRVAASVVAELTGAPANALYREVAEKRSGMTATELGRAQRQLPGWVGQTARHVS